MIESREMNRKLQRDMNQIGFGLMSATVLIGLTIGLAVFRMMFM